MICDGGGQGDDRHQFRILPTTEGCRNEGGEINPDYIFLCEEGSRYGTEIRRSLIFFYPLYLQGPNVFPIKVVRWLFPLCLQNWCFPSRTCTIICSNHNLFAPRAFIQKSQEQKRHGNFHKTNRDLCYILSKSHWGLGKKYTQPFTSFIALLSLSEIRDDTFLGKCIHITKVYYITKVFRPGWWLES